MNKTYSDQITKAQMLSKGILKNAEILQQRGLNINTEKLESTCKAFEDAAAKQEAAENVLRESRDKAHELLAELKRLCDDAKQPIKTNFPTEEWAKFGLTDKR